jgi:GTP-binding protein Era
MLIETQHPKNKRIKVAVLGLPSAGKSSLINHLIGFDLSIVSHKPQTTRNHYDCVFTVDHTEVVLVDSPGVQKINQEINVRMSHQVELATNGVDLNLVLIDGTKDVMHEVDDFLKGFVGELSKTWILFTKTDLVTAKANFPFLFTKVQEKIPSAEKFFEISTVNGNNIHLLTGALCDAATPGLHSYPDGSVSNMNERFFATEYIREQAFKILKEEVPYEIAVLIEEYKDKKTKDDTDCAHISAAILVNRPSQRAIVVGRGGSVIKEIGTGARQKIEAMVGGKVHLNLHVKVSPRWFANNFVLEELGLPRSQTQARVWRSKT